jgi:hypothetical protein
VFIVSNFFEKINPPEECCTSKAKVGMYNAAVTVVVLAVILGALIVVSHYQGLALGPLNGVMEQVIQFLGNYSFVPIAVSGSLFVVLVIGGIIWRCYTSAPKTPSPAVSGGGHSITLFRPYPEASLSQTPPPANQGTQESGTTSLTPRKSKLPSDPDEGSDEYNVLARSRRPTNPPPPQDSPPSLNPDASEQDNILANSLQQLNENFSSDESSSEESY